MAGSGMQEAYGRRPPPGAMPAPGVGQRPQYPYGPGYDRRWVRSSVSLEHCVHLFIEQMQKTSETNTPISYAKGWVYITKIIIIYYSRY